MKQKVEDFIKKIKEKNMKQKIGMIVLALFFVGLGSMTTWLFYNQAIGKFNSDLILHISSAISSSGSQYTITKPIYKFIYVLWGESGYCSFSINSSYFDNYSDKKTIRLLYCNSKRELN